MLRTMIARCRQLAPALAHVIRDRQGATMVVFALAGTAVIGMVGLGTEGGSWYLTRRDAQNAADAAAYAGAVRLSLAQSGLSLSLTSARTQARDAANDTATRNGFTTGARSSIVTVNSPPIAPSAYAADNKAVEVVVQRTVPRLLSGLFLSTDPVIRATGTSSLLATGQACILALSGGLTATGNSTVTAQSCALASNSSSSTSISLAGSTTVSASTLTSAGGCSGCSAATLTSPFTTSQPPTTDPFTALQAIKYPASCPAAAVTPPSGKSGTTTVSNPTGTLYWCSDFKLTGGAGTVDLKPGTYVLYDADMSLQGGTVTCSTCTPGGAGVTFVFTGSSPSKVGTVTINGGASMQLNAPGSGTYAGVVMYRDALATDQTSKINGGSGLNLIGGMYFPTSTLDFAPRSSTREKPLWAPLGRQAAPSANYSAALGIR
jgi:Flp pilus assembly protein TadG